MPCEILPSELTRDFDKIVQFDYQKEQGIMNLRFTKPGMSATTRNPFIGFEALGITSEDENDDRFTGGGGDNNRRPANDSEDDDDDSDDDDEDDSDEDDEKDDESADRNRKKSDEDDKPSRPERQAARYRVRAREAEKRAADLEARLKAIEDKDKPKDEIVARDLTEARDKASKADVRAANLAKENAFLRSNKIAWHDQSAVLKLIDFDEIDVDEDGTVDERQLARALRDLAKRKPYLVKKDRVQDEDTNDDDESSSRTSASTMNTRKGQHKKELDRAALARRFPVVGRG